jgi:hypothetical protein
MAMIFPGLHSSHKRQGSQKKCRAFDSNKKQRVTEKRDGRCSFLALVYKATINSSWLSDTWTDRPSQKSHEGAAHIG